MDPLPIQAEHEAPHRRGLLQWYCNYFRFISGCVQRLFTLAFGVLSSIASFGVLGFIASFGFGAARRQPTRQTSPPPSLLFWHWGVEFLFLFSCIMLPCTWVLGLVEILLGYLNDFYSSPHITSYVIVQHLLWFFTNKMADELRSDSPYSLNAEFAESVYNHLDDNGTSFYRIHEGFLTAVRMAPFTFFTSALILTVYLFFNIIHNPGPPNPWDGDAVSISYSFLAPTCIFIFGFLVLEVLTGQIMLYQQRLPINDLEA